MFKQLKIYDNCEMVTEARNTGIGKPFGKEILSAFLMVFVSSLISSMFQFIPALFITNPNDSNQVLLTFLYAQLAGISAVIWYCTKSEKRSVRSIGFTKRGVLKQYFSGLAIGLLMFSSVILLGVIFGGFKYVGVSENFNLGFVAMFFGGFIIQGMNEEVLCRGYIMISSSRKKPVVYGILLNSIIFALLHGANDGVGILPLINLTLFGVFASLYTLKTDNIWGIGAIHSVWNWSQGNLFGLSVSGNDPLPSFFFFESVGDELINGGAFGPEGGLCVTIVMVIGIALLLIPKRKKPKASEIQII